MTKKLKVFTFSQKIPSINGNSFESLQLFSLHELNKMKIEPENHSLIVIEESGATAKYYSSATGGHFGGIISENDPTFGTPKFDAKYWLKESKTFGKLEGIVIEPDVSKDILAESFANKNLIYEPRPVLPQIPLRGVGRVGIDDKLK